MLAIIQAESSCKPDEQNLSIAENHRVCVGSYGLLQIGCVHYQQAPTALLDPALNIQKGYEVWLKQGYKAWTVYLTGVYQKYL